MRLLLNIALLLLAAPLASATSYAFTISNGFSQSVIVAEVEVTATRIYPSDLLDFKEVEVECKVLAVFKGPADLASFRARFHGAKEPAKGKALVFAFRHGRELRVFNGGSFLVLASTPKYKEIRSEVVTLKKKGSAKPMKGFEEKHLGDVTTLEADTVKLAKGTGEQDAAPQIRPR